MSRIIAHVDMDAFFAAVEQRDHPALHNKAVVVGANPKKGKGRGVVSTCSYEARKFGVHSAMPISLAYQKCPHAIFLPVNYAKYSSVSAQIFQVFEQFTPDIQPVSIDEAFLDITESFHLYKTPYLTGLRIKEAIKSKVNLNASIGIAPIKMAAKLASDFSKPNGLLEINEDNLIDFLWPKPIEKLWGVGPKSKIFFNQLGIKTVGQLAKQSADFITARLGEHGLGLWQLANGLDSRRVETNQEIKSVSREHTFEVDSGSKEEILETILYLSEKVSRRLRQYQLKGRTLTLKIRLKGFKTYTRSLTLSDRTNFIDSIYQKSSRLFEEFYRPGMQIRLIGVRVNNFAENYVQESLFIDQVIYKKEGIHLAVDRIKDRFGERAIHWGR